ncbi:2380_t:CDS:2, partial [Acaulospora morrowiae]
DQGTLRRKREKPVMPNGKELELPIMGFQQSGGIKIMGAIRKSGGKQVNNKSQMNKPYKKKKELSIIFDSTMKVYGPEIGNTGMLWDQDHYELPMLQKRKQEWDAVYIKGSVCTNKIKTTPKNQYTRLQNKEEKDLHKKNSGNVGHCGKKNQKSLNE